MRPALVLVALLHSGCGSLGAFQTPAVLAPGKVRFGFETAGGKADERRPDVMEGVGALRIDAGLGRGVEVSAMGGAHGGGGVVKVALPTTRVRGAVFVGASRYAYEGGFFGYGYLKDEATTAFAGVSVAGRRAAFEIDNGRGPLSFRPYAGIRLVHVNGRSAEDCERCEYAVKRLRRLVPAASLGLAFAETIGPRLEASVYLAPEPVVMFGLGVRF